MSNQLNSKSQNSNKSTYILLACIFIGGPLSAFLIVFLTAPEKPKQQATTQIPIPNAQKALSPQTVNSNQTNLIAINKPSKNRDYITNIINLDNITEGDSYNHLLQVTITNPYDKPIANVQIYLSYNGNAYIPDDISEDSQQLINMKIKILPDGSEHYTIDTKDKGANNRDYVVSVRRIRLNDGTTIKP